MPDDNELQHQTEMSDSERRSTGTWYVLKTIGKWMLGGALVVGAVAAIAPVALTLTLGSSAIQAGGWWSAAAGAMGFAVPETAKHMGEKVLETVGAWALNWGTTGAAIGAVAAGVFGAGYAATHVGRHIEDVNEEQMDNYERGIQRQRQIQAMKMQQRQLDLNMRKMEEQYGLSQPNLPNRNAGKGMEIG